MPNDKDELIRVRAHQLWERDGRPDGKEQEHWAEASRQIEAEGAGHAENSDTAATKRGPAQPAGGIASGLQPGGSTPGGGPGASKGSLGTGGGSTAGKSTGSARRTRR